LESLRETAVDVEPDAPEVAAEIHAELRRFCDEDLLHRVVAASHDDVAGTAALRVLEALGPYAAEAVIGRLSTEADRGARRELVELLCTGADALASSLVSQAGEDQEWFVTRNLIRIIGHAGPGHEEFLIGYLGSENAKLVKESLQALARIGTERALRSVMGVLDEGDHQHADLAEQTLWKFPNELVGSAVEEWLEVPENPLASPALAVRLLNRLSARPGFTIGERVGALCRYRLHFWTPGLRKLGATVARLGGSR
jgi:HEAT repeat protein